MTRKRLSTSSCASTADGSSMTISRTSWARARARLTICWPAAESRPTSRCGRDLAVPEALEDGAGGVDLVAAPHEAAVGELVAEVDVVGDREARDEVQLLVDRRDAELQRRLRAGEVHLLALPAHGALVGPVRPGQDLDEGGLAGAVLAQEAVHLAGADVEVDAVQRAYTGELLDDAAHLQQGIVVGRRLHAAPLHRGCAGPPGEPWAGCAGRAGRGDGCGVWAGCGRSAQAVLRTESETSLAAPMTPAVPPSSDRTMGRFPVASGRDRR